MLLLSHLTVSVANSVDPNQCGSKSDCSSLDCSKRSSLIFIHTICLYAVTSPSSINIQQTTSADIIYRFVFFFVEVERLNDGAAENNRPCFLFSYGMQLSDTCNTASKCESYQVEQAYEYASTRYRRYLESTL